MLHGMNRKARQLDQMIMQIIMVAAAVVDIHRQQIHGILMLHGVKANKIMLTLPLQVIKLIKYRLVLMEHRKTMVKNKLEAHQHRNSTNQKIQKHHKS